MPAKLDQAARIGPLAHGDFEAAVFTREGKQAAFADDGKGQVDEGGDRD